MTLQPFPSVFPYILGKFLLLFYQCSYREKISTTRHFRHLGHIVPVEVKKVLKKYKNGTI
jgi:hypothetical protein